MRYLRSFLRSPSSPGSNPAQRRVLPQIQTFARSSGWWRRRRRRLPEPGPVARSVGAPGCEGRNLRAARASPQPAGARAPRSPRSLSPSSPTEPRHRLPPSSNTSASRARPCHFLSAPAAAAPASSSPLPPPSLPRQSPRVPKEGGGAGKAAESCPAAPRLLGHGGPRGAAGEPGGRARHRRLCADRAEPGVGRCAGCAGAAAGLTPRAAQLGVGAEAAPTLLPPRPNPARLM